MLKILPILRQDFLKGRFRDLALKEEGSVM